MNEDLCLTFCLLVSKETKKGEEEREEGERRGRKRREKERRKKERREKWSELSKSNHPLIFRLESTPEP